MPMTRLIAYICPDCGVWVRDVDTTWGEVLTLNAARDPQGRVVPWASENLNGSAVARVIPAGVPAEDDRTYSVHVCAGTPGSNLFKEEPSFFGTRMMWSDARNEEFLYEECPGPRSGHQALPLLLKYAEQHPQHTGNFRPGVDDHGRAIVVFLPDPGQSLEGGAQALYNHDPDTVTEMLQDHGARGVWIPDLGLAQLEHPWEDGPLISFSSTPVKPCSLPLT